MTDEIDILCAIVANPEEDTPRLMYADWLDEHTDRHEFAEFIRTHLDSLKARWRARQRFERFETGTEHPASVVLGVRQLDLTLDLPYGPALPAGISLGTIRASDESGAGVWECQAFLYAVVGDDGTGVVTYEAKSLGVYAHVPG